MRTVRAVLTTIAGCAVLSGCATVIDGTAVAPTALDELLPTAGELSDILGIGSAGFPGQLVHGDADMLLRGVGHSEASPADCVGASYQLQKVVYDASPVRGVATQPWAGGDPADPAGPAVSAFVGVVELVSADDAQAFFAATVEDWRGCDGTTMVLHQPDHDTRAHSTITEVVVDGPIVSAVVHHDGGPAVQRALGVAADCIVDVEITDTRGGSAGAAEAAGVADVMLDKITGG